jgi:hypothetical protein
LTFSYGRRSSLLVVDVTLMYFDDCPNWKVADGHLRALAAEVDDLGVTRHLVETPEEAERVRFRGSPSILINGVDAFADPDAPVGLSCRVYQTPDGPAGSPTIEQLRAVLTAADS